MTSAALRANFPDDVPLPALLARLYTFAESNSDHLGGDLYLTATGHRSLERGTRNAPQLADRFIVFARDRSGSMYGYWRYDGQPLDGAPLVYLSDEGQDNTVLATTLEEFLSIVAVGQQYLGLVDKWDEGEQPDEDTLRYRDWLRADVGIETPTLDQARSIVERARASHPDLDAWLDQALGL